MADTTYQPSVYRKRGGTELVIATGGSLTIESGGTFTIDGTPVTGADHDLAIAGVNATAGEINTLYQVVAGTRSASKAVVLSSGSAINQWDVAQTITSATPATTRLTRSELTITPATSVAVGSNGSLAGVRGAVTLTSGKSITDGYLYGTQGKAILDGATINVGSDHVAGVYAQMSAAGATFTSGHIAPLMSVGQSLPAGIASMIYCENNDVTILNAVVQAVANANFVLDCTSEDSNSAYLVTTAGGAASKYMRVKLSGVEYRIALLAAS